MRAVIIGLILAYNIFANAYVNLPGLVVDSAILGCGFSDLVYANLEKNLSQKSTMNIPVRSKANETGRRLYFFSDRSWFLTLEFLSEETVDKDISCVVAKGSGDQSEDALSYVLKVYPNWLWGRQPTTWPWK